MTPHPSNPSSSTWRKASAVRPGDRLALGATVATVSACSRTGGVDLVADDGRAWWLDTRAPVYLTSSGRCRHPRARTTHVANLGPRA